MRHMRDWGTGCAVLCLSAMGLAAAPNTPIVDETVVFEEVGGQVAVEAEYFYKQTRTDKRAWYRHSAEDRPETGRDVDPSHVFGSGNNAYIEILPDTRANHSEDLIHGENFSNRGGAMCVAHYSVYFNTPGRYYVWVRAFSTGSEDNGLHVGIDDTWPASGERMQWCEGKHSWRWESKQRTAKEHCGEPHKIYLDVEEAGWHEIAFSMREDGFEFDRFLLTTDREFQRPSGVGPAVRVKRGTLLPPFPEVTYLDLIGTMAKDAKIMKAVDFPVEGTGFHRDDDRWLSIDPDRNEKAQTAAAFSFEEGTYDIVFLGVGEKEGRNVFRVAVGGRQIGKFTCPLASQGTGEGPRYSALWRNVELRRGAAVSVEAQIASEHGHAHSRGRWLGVVFVPTVQDGKARGVNPLVVATAGAQQRAQIVGIRFQNVNIPKGTRVKEAWIQFTVDEDKSADPFEVTITGQSADHAHPFSLDAYDVSSRPRTRASTVWKDIPTWRVEDEAGPDQRTPDLAAIVREIVARDGWDTGNAMVFLLEGSGTRTAVSYEKSARTRRPQTAPQLVIVLHDRTELHFGVAQDTDDMEEVVAGGSIDHGSTDLELCVENP